MSLIKPFRGGFKNGINTYNDTYDQTGMNFDILIMEKNETFSICEGEKEIAVTVIQGKGVFHFQDEEVVCEARHSVKILKIREKNNSTINGPALYGSENEKYEGTETGETE